MIEITIIIKNDSVKYQEKHLCYEGFMMSPKSDDLKELVQSAYDKFTGDKDDVDVIIKTKMVW